MPWQPADAARHNKKATGKAANQWSAVANSVLAKTGNEGRAVREANAVIARRKAGLDTVHLSKGGKVPSARSMVANDDPNRGRDTQMPNVYRGKLAPPHIESDSGSDDPAVRPLKRI